VSKRSILRGMSKRTAIAATSVLALGGSLAVVSSASATQLPTGSSTDPGYTFSGTATSLWSISNGITNNLVTAAEIDQGATTGAGDTHNTLPATPAISDAAGLSSTNVPMIATDWANSANEADYIGVIEESQSVSPTVAQAEYTQLAGAVPQLAAAYAADYSSIQQLIGLAGDDASQFPGGLYTVDSDASVSSTATVKATAAPAQYSMTIATSGGAVASGKQGYILPSAFSLTFPKQLGINTGLLGDVVPSGPFTTPPKGATPIGTVTLVSPAAKTFGLSTTDTVSGKIYAVKWENPPAGTNSLIPELELYLGNGFYDLGQLNGIAFPLTVSFGETQLPGGSQDPLPLSSLTMSYPAATSPVEATSCKSLGTLTAAATDAVANLAGDFGDTTDGFANNTASPVPLTASPTKVTDNCTVPTKLTASKGSASGTRKGKPAFGFKLTDNKDFSSFTVTLPKGFSYSKFSTKDLKVTGGKVRKVSAKGTKLTVTLKSATKSVTAKLSKGIKETKSAKKDKSVTLKLGASSKTASLKIKA
jgi:hypothetical protein